MSISKQSSCMSVSGTTGTPAYARDDDDADDDEDDEDDDDNDDDADEETEDAAEDEDDAATMSSSALCAMPKCGANSRSVFVSPLRNASSHRVSRSTRVSPSPPRNASHTSICRRRESSANPPLANRPLALAVPLAMAARLAAASCALSLRLSAKAGGRRDESGTSQTIRYDRTRVRNQQNPLVLGFNER